MYYTFTLDITTHLRELMDNSVEKQTPKNWVSDALIIAAFPIVAYVITYAYESGYAGIFGIPSQFIALNLITFLVVTGALTGVILSLFMYANFILLILPKSDSPLFRGIIKLFPMILLSVAYLILYGKLWHYWIIPIGVIALIFLIEFGFPLITQKGRPSYREKYDEQEKLESNVKGIFEYVIPLVGRGPAIAIVYLSIFLILSSEAGRSRALKQDEFLIIKASPELVVLRIYGEKLICAPFDRTTKEITRTFTILKTGDDPNLKLSLEKVGPLHIKKQTDEK